MRCSTDRSRLVFHSKGDSSGAETAPEAPASSVAAEPAITEEAAVPTSIAPTTTAAELPIPTTEVAEVPAPSELPVESEPIAEIPWATSSIVEAPTVSADTATSTDAMEPAQPEETAPVEAMPSFTQDVPVESTTVSKTS